MNGRVKIKKLKIPNKYKQLSLEIFDYFFKKYKKDLRLYCLLGSLAREEVIDGWSDVDILIILSKKECEDLLSVIPSFSCKGVDVGLTVYFEKDLAKPKYLDGKTVTALRKIKNNEILPQINYIKELNISKELEINKAEADLARFLKDLRRIIFNKKRLNRKKTAKLLYAIANLCLKKDNFFTDGYKEIRFKFQENNNFLLPRIEEIHNKVVPDTRLRERSAELIMLVVNYSNIKS